MLIANRFRRYRLPTLIFLCLGIFLATDAYSDVELPLINLPSDNYYTATPDLRKCAPPVCGGAWISQVNRRQMRCADGSLAESCYVWSIEYDEMTDHDIRNGKTLIHGRLEKTQFSADQVLPKLVADSAYAPLFEENLENGNHALLTNTGLVCITAPCPTLELQTLNQKRIVNVSRLLFDDRLTPEDHAFVLDQSQDRGVLVYGKAKPSDAGVGGFVDYTVQNAYQKIPAHTQQVCGGLLGTSCPRGQYCLFEPKAACGFADQTGICEPVPNACLDIFQPVCGCDGNTYSNSCYAALDGVSVAHEGACDGGGAK